MVVLGTAQDGGLPHAGCHCRRCTAARADPAKRRHAAALGIVLPAEKKLFLLDATPDLPAQLEMLAPYRGEPAPERVDRGLLSGILLTHAHMGHYLGLAHFGFEVCSTKGVPVYASAAHGRRSCSKNGPWSQLVRLENIAIREVPPGETFDLPGGRARDRRSRCRTATSTRTRSASSSAASAPRCSTCRTRTRGAPGPSR